MNQTQRKHWVSAPFGFGESEPEECDITDAEQAPYKGPDGYEEVIQPAVVKVANMLTPR